MIFNEVRVITSYYDIGIPQLREFGFVTITRSYNYKHAICIYLITYFNTRVGNKTLTVNIEFNKS